jgi:hypothetical protein
MSADHTLMQTIGLANRVFRDKRLILDYVSVSRDLRKALVAAIDERMTPEPRSLTSDYCSLITVH